jgi:hypothetical protein
MIPPPAQRAMAKRAGATVRSPGSPIGGIGLEPNVAHIQLPG